MNIVIGKVKDEHGCWGNMAPYPILYQDKTWLTSEALFQALRFSDEIVKEEIRTQKSPMSAKMVAKKYKDKMIVQPMSETDLNNMRLVLSLKLKQHPELSEILKNSDAFIVEDCTKRQRGSGLFWGAALKDDKWVGENWLGKLWMEIREKLKVSSIVPVIPGLVYIPNFISDAQQEYLIKDIDEKLWSNELRRRVQHYGFKYDYTKRSINESMKVGELLPWMNLYGQKFIENKYFDQLPDQVIINEYTPGQGIAKHIDCEPCFKKNIASLSLLSSCIMEFTKGTEVREICLEPKSLLVITGEARYDWRHGIPSRTSDHGVPRSRRVSVTFRNVIL